MASQQAKAFCVFRFEVPRSVITVQHEFCARFKKDAPHKNNVKTEHIESLLLLQRHLGNWPFGAAVSMRSELLVSHGRLGQFPLLTVYVVPM
jgi:hypothetical protein